MRNYINLLTTQFLEEAKKAPNLIADMAQMEKYMAESYNNRAFIELIQNADDANARRIDILYRNGNLYVANDGFPFSQSDIEAICRSGASKKNRNTSIGYRGVGFKSTTCFSTTIYIHSGNYTFAFSKAMTAQRLHVNAESVPTVRVPYLFDDEMLETNVLYDIQALTKKGFTTVFAFQNVDYNALLSEKNSIGSDCMLFLKSLNSLCFEGISHFVRFERTLEKHENYTLAKIFDEQNSKEKIWYLLGGDQSFVIAIPYHDKSQAYLFGDSDDKNVFHCFLPTMDETGFGFRVNGDFSTDPSRKHVVSDDRTLHTIQKVGEYLASSTLESLSNHEDWTNRFFASITDYRVKNLFGAKILQVFQETLKNKKIIEGITGCSLTIDEAILLPEWIDERVLKAMRVARISSNRYVMESDPNRRKLFVFLGIQSLKLYELCPLLNNKIAVFELDYASSSKLLLHTIGSEKNEKGSCNLNKLYLNVNNEVLLLPAAIQKNGVIEYLNKIANSIGEKSTLDYICKELGVNIHTASVSPIDRILSRKRVIPKWQTAEQLCVEIEERQGNRATDVSKNNMGYDVLSEASDGTKKYIEVKSLKTIGEPVILTNNEYTTAHQYGNEYYLCLIVQGDSPSVLYIQDPLHNEGHFEKRVRMWEWVFSDYQGQFVKIEI